MVIKPAPIIAIPNVPETRVVHWIDYGPGYWEERGELFPCPCVTIYRRDDITDFYPGEWS